MSVHNNIPQHPAPQRTKVTALYDSVRESYMNLPAPMKLDRSWWPASRPVPSDGRSVARVQKQIRTVNNLRMCRLMEAEQVEAQLGF